MTIKKKLFYYSLILCYFLSSSTVWSNAPSSLAGKKVTITNSLSKYFDIEWYVLEDGTKTWSHDIEDGEWELDLLTWSKTSSNRGNIELGTPSD